jgi:hypothetical protein
LSTTAGLFINPFDIDDNTTTMYASFGANVFARWPNANTSNTFSTITFAGIGTPTALKVSTNAENRLFIGTNSGRVYRIENVNTVTSATVAANATNITGAGFPAGYINCVNTGSTDNYLVAVFTNYGVNNVWYSKDGGTSWTAIDGNLPDMPVRWAVFHPQYNNRLFLGTEAGVYATDAVNGANTVWTPEVGFPTVRTTMLKIRASDNTMVASTHGRGLFTAVIPTSNVPEINFDSEVLHALEATASTEGCRRFKNYTVELSAMNVPAGNAVATFNVTNGTARKGVDFDFTTNGSFDNPSNQLTFADGSTDKQTINIRIYDDVDVEATESFTLAFSVSGTTNAKAGSVNSLEVHIRDNDKLPSVSAANFTVGTFNSQIIAASPLTGNRVKHRTQSLFTASELKAAGINNASKITSMAFNVLTKNSTKAYKGFTISMAHISAGAMTQFAHIIAPATSFTTVYSGDYNSIEGANVFNFTTPFEWDGTSNIVVQICYDNTGMPLDAAADYLEGNSYPLGLTVRATVYANYSTGETAGCSLPAAFISDFRFNATFGVDYGTTMLAATAGSKKTEYFSSANDLHYYAQNGNLITRLKNLTDANFVCTEAMIDRAGTGAARFWNANKENMLMDKTYQITSAGKSQSGLVNLTFYFTKEEKEGWEKATGQPWKNIQLVRVKGKISDITPSNSQGSSGAVLEAVMPVHGMFGNGYTLTGTFNGLGGFGAGIPGKQFTVLIVKANGNMGNGNANSNARTSSVSGIKVEWTTSSETNTSYFEVEKSYDGSNFRKIATVNAAGNKATESSYSFMDTDNAQVNYYRITLYHSDKTVLMSNTVVVRNDAAVQQMFVLSNPFRDNIRLRFARVTESPVSVRVLDMQGRTIKSYMAPAGSNLLTIDMNAVKVMSGGIYEVDVTIDGQHYRAKLLKQ